MEYCSSVWDPYGKGDVATLEKVQCGAERFVKGDYKRESSVTQMMCDLGWQSLEVRRDVSRLIPDVHFGAPPRDASPCGRPFSRARVYFAGIAKIRDYSQSIGPLEPGSCLWVFLQLQVKEKYTWSFYTAKILFSLQILYSAVWPDATRVSVEDDHCAHQHADAPVIRAKHSFYHHCS